MPNRVAIEKSVSPGVTVWVVAAGVGGVGVAGGDGVADGVGAAVDDGAGVDAETEGDGESAEGDGPTDAVVQAPSAIAAAMTTPASLGPGALVRVIAEV